MHNVFRVLVQELIVICAREHDPEGIVIIVGVYADDWHRMKADMTGACHLPQLSDKRDKCFTTGNGLHMLSKKDKVNR